MLVHATWAAETWGDIVLGERLMARGGRASVAEARCRARGHRGCCEHLGKGIRAKWYVRFGLNEVVF